MVPTPLSVSINFGFFEYVVLIAVGLVLVFALYVFIRGFLSRRQQRKFTVLAKAKLDSVELPEDEISKALMEIQRDSTGVYDQESGFNPITGKVHHRKRKIGRKPDEKPQDRIKLGSDPDYKTVVSGTEPVLFSKVDVPRKSFFKRRRSDNDAVYESLANPKSVRSRRDKRPSIDREVVGAVKSLDYELLELLAQDRPLERTSLLTLGAFCAAKSGVKTAASSLALQALGNTVGFPSFGEGLLAQFPDEFYEYSIVFNPYGLELTYVKEEALTAIAVTSYLFLDNKPMALQLAGTLFYSNGKDRALAAYTAVVCDQSHLLLSGSSGGSVVSGVVEDSVEGSLLMYYYAWASLQEGDLKEAEKFFKLVLNSGSSSTSLMVESALFLAETMHRLGKDDSIWDVLMDVPLEVKSNPEVVKVIKQYG